MRATAKSHKSIKPQVHAARRKGKFSKTRHLSEYNINTPRFRCPKAGPRRVKLSEIWFHQAPSFIFGGLEGSGSRCGASQVTLVTRRRGWVPRARRIFRRYLPAEILTYLIINFLWAGLSLWLVSTLVSRTRVFTDREGASGGRSAATPRAQYTVTGSDSRGRLGRRAY